MLCFHIRSIKILVQWMYCLGIYYAFSGLRWVRKRKGLYVGSNSIMLFFSGHGNHCLSK